MSVANDSLSIDANESSVVLVTLERSLPALGSPTVTVVATSNGAQVDFDGVVNFANGSTSASFNVTVLDDGFAEPATTVTLTVASVSGTDGDGRVSTTQATSSINIEAHGPCVLSPQTLANHLVFSDVVSCKRI